MALRREEPMSVGPLKKVTTLPRTKGRAQGTKNKKTQMVCAQLRANPGVWFLLLENRKSVSPVNVMRTYANAPLGYTRGCYKGYETTTRTVGPNKKNLYIRYVGDVETP